MKRIVLFACFAGVLTCAGVAAQQLPYEGQNRLNVPEDYREWVFLTSSLDLNYSDATADRSVLDNVFVNRDAYRAFVRTGTWPDKTIIVKENRIAASAGTISKSGKFQTQVLNMEMHVKDEARFPGKWAFFVSSDGKAPGMLVPTTAACYSCHSAHGAVDTTFVQFYPTLLEIAKGKNTLSSGYLNDQRSLVGSK
ncbi:MAG TPA: cytochrome P460 family protein [Micropepsaceae bacterium]|nr:cytochrome P460 family protein [Micropepsaceae bacterium]